MRIRLAFLLRVKKTNKIMFERCHIATIYNLSAVFGRISAKVTSISA
ncbi:hypothetical protein [Bacillus sp. UNC41MFS5]|nr:hypothetical protein [Bacillus sp. UNC41MFS5]